MGMPLDEFDTSDFWDESKYAIENYVGETVTDELLKSVEQELGYRLPEAYVELMKQQNGGIPARSNHRTSEPTSWSKDHVAIAGIFGIGRDKPYSLCGSGGSTFWIDEWGYPSIGVYFADCPSAGHDMLCLDYRKCGPDGEPRVVHVDQESDYKVTPVTDTFEDFIRGLESDDAFEEDGVELNEDQVVSAWIDPEFAKQMGIEAPEDGWLKKEDDSQDDSDEE